MSPTARVAARVVGRALLAIAFLITFIPSQRGFSVWNYGDGPSGPWSVNAMIDNATMLVVAGIVAVVGLTAIRLSHDLPDAD